jgi:hypothetical protein
MFWIDANLDEHYFCLYYNLWSHIILGTEKGNQTHYHVICISHLRKEMKSITNNMIYLQAQTFLISSITYNFL